MNRQGLFLAKALEIHQEYEVAKVVIFDMLCKRLG